MSIVLQSPGRTRITILLVIGLFSFISYGLRLTYPGIFWDDWGLMYVSKSTLIANWTDSGRPILGYYYSAISALPASLTIYPLLTFFAYITASYLLFLILSENKYLSIRQSAYAALLFAVLPLNQARDASVISQYAVSLVLLLFGLRLSLKQKIWAG